MRRAAAAMIALALACAATGATVASFTSTTSNSGNTFSAAASFATLGFVKTVGSASCGGTSDAVTVPAGGVPVGNTLVIRAAFRSGSVGSFTPTVNDSKGNSYSLDVSRVSGSVRSVIFSAYVATALAASDTVTVSHAATDGSAVSVEEFSGIRSSGPLDQTATGAGSDANPTATVSTTNADDAIVGAVAQNQVESATQPNGWSALPTAGGNCGGASSEVSIHGAYRIVSATGSYTYDPTLGTSRQWADVITSYKD